MIGNKKPPPAPPKGGECKSHQASTASPDPSERRGVPMCTRGIRGRALYLIVFCKILANLHSPPFGGVGGGFFLYYTYLSVKQIVTKAFAELVTPVPRKTIVFRIKLLTFAKQKRKSLTNSPTRPTASPPTPLRMERGVNSKISPKKFKS